MHPKQGRVPFAKLAIGVSQHGGRGKDSFQKKTMRNECILSWG